MTTSIEGIEKKCIEIILEAILETSQMIVGKSDIEFEEVKNRDEHLDENLILLGITGQVNGDLIFDINEAALKYIANKMTGMEIKEIDELASSAMVEYINMVSGSATIKLVDYFDSDKLKMSPPVFLRGKEINIGGKADMLKTYQVKFEKTHNIMVTVVLTKVEEIGKLYN